MKSFCRARPADPGQFLKVRHVAQELGITRQTIYRLIAEGQLPFSRIGSGTGTIRIRRGDLDAFLLRARATTEQTA